LKRPRRIDTFRLAMPSCPVCRVSLSTVRQREGIYFHCSQCGGRAATIPQVRRVAGDKAATQLLRQINNARATSSRSCPFCLQGMKEFKNADPPLTLDACRPCGLVWFDSSEFEALPEVGVASPNELELRGREALALDKVRQIQEQASKQFDQPDASWQYAVALLGLPVELDDGGLKRMPLATWSIAAAILMVSGLAFLNLDAAVENYGFIPAQCWRYGGLTFLSSFFLHAGVWHLLGNLYFFLVFGDNVEDYLGRWRFVLLLVAATVGGDLAALVFEPRAQMPAIGASGGISGVLVFYALEFPRARLGFVFRFFYWFSLPAWGALAIWMLLQVFTTAQQLHGLTNTSGLAHLGGAALGFAWWLKWGHRQARD
jgi:membrane associated rhomboid family serine protease/Zn-finger nucleic acid-binding protein